MITQYTVIQFVPNPVAGEIVNVGVIALQGNQVKCKTDLHRARTFGRDKDAYLYLQEFIEGLMDRCQIGERKDPITEATLQDWISNWHSTIRLTPFRGGALELDAMLDHASRVFLGTDAPGRRTAVTKYIPIRIAKNVFTEIIKNRHLEGLYHVKPGGDVSGTSMTHPIDLGLYNHSLRLFIRGINYNIKTNGQLGRDVRDIALSILDLKPANQGLDMAVVIDGPTSHPEHEGLEKVCRSHDVSIVPTAEIKNWAEQTIDNLLAA